MIDILAFGPFITGILLSVGFSLVSYWLSSQAEEPEQASPKMGGSYPIQMSMKGGPIPKVYGTEMLAGNMIHDGGAVPYGDHSGETEEYDGGWWDLVSPIIESGIENAEGVGWKRSFLLGICEGPAVILKAWKGKKEIPLTDFTWFEGNNNTGIKALTGEDYGKYPNLCCAFFNQYDLGNTEAVPNFTFEVASGTGIEAKILIYDLAGLQAMNDDLTGDYALMTDLDASDTSTWNGGEGFVPIGASGDEFIGTMDGRNHTIDGLYVNLQAFPGKHGGLFSHVGDSGGAGTPGSVSNLRLTNQTSYNRGEAGLMVGRASGGSTFTDCFVSGNMYIGLGHYSGGFVGRSDNDCIYTRCGVTGSLTLSANNDGYGGFVGFIDGQDNIFTDCYARFSIDRGDCNSNSWTGGFCGREDQQSSTFTNCYAAASIQYANSCYTYTTDSYPVSYSGGGIIGSRNAGNTFSSCYYDQTAAQATYPDAAQYDSGYVNDRQRAYLNQNMTAGHYHVTHDGNTTGEIAWDANSATVQAALDAAWGAGEVIHKFDGSDEWDTNSHWKIMFYGSTYGASPQADITFDMAAIVPGGTTATIDGTPATGVSPLSDANITLKTTAQMQTESTFIGWDFDDVWYMGSSGYPELRAHRLSGLDVNPADIIEDIIEHKRYGVGDTTIIDNTSLDAARAYWAAQNMLLSVTLDDQKPWLDWVDYVLNHVSGYRFKSEGKLKFGVRKDESAVDSITQYDFVTKESDSTPPVNINERPRSDTFNWIEVGFTDRTAKYDIDYKYAKDDVDIRQFGIRKKTIRLKGIHDGDLALRIAYRFLIDAMFRFCIYEFTLSFNKMLLENGDVITLTDGELLSADRVRIVSIREDKNGRGLAVKAVDDLAVHYPDVTSLTTQESLYQDVPAVTLGDASVNFREDINSAKLFLSVVPANAQFNGAAVYGSFDDISFSLLGRFAVDGVTSGDSNSEGTVDGFIPDHPAVTWAKDESMLVSIGSVTDLRTAITDEQFWNDRALARIGTEIISFKAAVETATAGIWQISNLRRGLLGTEPVAHYTGESFETLDINFRYTFSPTDIGKTMYFKVVSFYGADIQQLADVSSYSAVIGGYYARPATASLLRLTSDENDGGGYQYTGATFTLYWNLGSRVSGFNVVDWLNLPWNNYVADPDMQDIALRFETEAGTLILERYISIANSETITKATDLGGNDRAVIKVVPRRALRPRLENSFLVEST